MQKGKGLFALLIQGTKSFLSIGDKQEPTVSHAVSQYGCRTRDGASMASGSPISRSHTEGRFKVEKHGWFWQH